LGSQRSRQRGHNLSHERAVLAVAPVSVPSAAQFGDKGGIEPTLAAPTNAFDKGNPVNPRDIVLVRNAIEKGHVEKGLLLHGCLLLVKREKMRDHITSIHSFRPVGKRFLMNSAGLQKRASILVATREMPYFQAEFASPARVERSPKS